MKHLWSVTQMTKQSVQFLQLTMQFIQKSACEWRVQHFQKITVCNPAWVTADHWFSRWSHLKGESLSVITWSVKKTHIRWCEHKIGRRFVFWLSDSESSDCVLETHKLLKHLNNRIHLTTSRTLEKGRIVRNLELSVEDYSGKWLSLIICLITSVQTFSYHSDIISKHCLFGQQMKDKRRHSPSLWTFGSGRNRLISAYQERIQEGFLRIYGLL